MSHFTVLVVGDNAEEQLAPFDENDRDQFMDEEQEYLEEYNTKTMEAVVFNDGRIFTKYDDAMKPHWKREGIGISSKDKFIVPKGAELKEVPAKQIYPTFEAFMEGWHSMERDEEFGKYGSRRNPKAKWDWYSLGGRWTGFFKLKSKKSIPNVISRRQIGALALQYNTTTLVVETLIELVKEGDFNKISDYNRKNPVVGGYHLEKQIQALLTPEYEDAAVGEPGLGTGVAKEGYVDSARVKDIDFEGMVREAGQEAKERYENVERLMGGTIPKLEHTWSSIIDDKGPFASMDIDAKRAMYHNQPAKKLVEKARNNPRLSKDDQSLLTWLDLEQYQVTKEQYVARAEGSALSTFAVLKDGEWFEKGEMGWWGMVANEMEQEKWNEEFLKLIRGLPEDTVISVYDCHI